MSENLLGFRPFLCGLHSFLGLFLFCVLGSVVFMNSLACIFIFASGVEGFSDLKLLKT